MLPSTGGWPGTPQSHSSRRRPSAHLPGSVGGSLCQNPASAQRSGVSPRYEAAGQRVPSVLADGGSGRWSRLHQPPLLGDISIAPSSCSFHPLGGFQGRLSDEWSESSGRALSNNSAEEWLRNGGTPPEEAGQTCDLLEAELLGGANCPLTPVASTRRSGSSARSRSRVDGYGLVDVQLGELPSGLAPSPRLARLPEDGGDVPGDTQPLPYQFASPRSVRSMATPGVRELEAALLEIRGISKVERQSTQEMLAGAIVTACSPSKLLGLGRGDGGQAGTKEEEAATKIQAVERGRRERLWVLRAAAEEVLGLRQKVQGYENKLIPQLLLERAVDKAMLRCELAEACAERDALQEMLESYARPSASTCSKEECTPKDNLSNLHAPPRGLRSIPTPSRARFASFPTATST